MPSESMAELPVNRAATNLATAMMRLAPMAPYMVMGVVEDPDFMVVLL
jgi:hypothetical protein